VSFRGNTPRSPLLRPPSGDAYATTQGGANPPSPLLRSPSGDAYATTQGGANPPSRKPALRPNPTL
jgi:hypothetical protein